MNQLIKGILLQFCLVLGCNYLTKAPKNTPTYGSRAIGYFGLTMYETVVYASPKHRSVIRKLSDTLAMPTPDLKQAYCWELALNAGQAYMLKALYSYTIYGIEPIDSLENALHQHYATLVSPEVVARSEEYGKTVAAKLYEWSKSDGGHEGYLRNFPAATVLTELYGPSFSFTDNTHANRPDMTYYVENKVTDKTESALPGTYPSFGERNLKYESRHYSSFWEAAQECANSRLMGGIHTRHDNEVGLSEGKKIGRSINALRWH